MKTDIRLSIEHSYFRDPIETCIKWECPFLPRVGEHINGWIWIDEKEMTHKDFASKLTLEGEKSFQRWDGDFSDWLYEVSIETGNVKSISYFRDKENLDKIEVYLFLGE